MAFLARLRDFFRRRKIAANFDEEMAFHLEELTQRHLARGLSPAEARAAAQRDFGNVLQAREDLRAGAGFPTWDEIAGDFRIAWRGLRRRPWLSLSVVLILGLGLGAAATIYGLIDAVFLRPLPVPHPGELYAVASPDPNIPDRLSRGTVGRLEADLPPGSVAGYGGGARCTVQIGSQPAIRVNTRLVTGSFFQTLQVAPSAGRALEPDDDKPGAPGHVVMVSYTWAVTNFGVPQAAIGRELAVNRAPVTIVGVLPQSFHEVSVGQTTDLWFPAALQPTLRIFGNASISEGDDRPNDPDWNREERISWLQILVRVHPGQPVPVAALTRAWGVQRDNLMLAEDNDTGRNALRHRAWNLVPAPGGQSRLRDNFRATGWLLSSVVGVMLVLVCVNVSGLLLVRSMSRHREIGVRLALGAGSLRVVRLGFFEALLLSVAGGLGGWMLAQWALPATARLLAPGQELDTALGLRSIALMGALALVTAVLSALAPALWLSRVQPLGALAGRGGLGRAPVRFGRVLVVAQFALAVALVAVAAALGAELRRVAQADPGFERDHVVTALFDASAAGYDQKTVFPLLERLKSAALAVPGVTGASFSATGILAGSESNSTIHLRNAHARMPQGHSQHDSVMPDYFKVVGMPVLVGRDLTAADDEKAPRVAVITEAFAREVLGDVNPVGERFGFEAQPSDKDWTIVGVVADVRVNGVREAAPAMFYAPLRQWEASEPSFLAVRFDGPEASVQESLRAALARAEPGLVLTSWKTLHKRMDDDLSGDLATTRLASIFGACAVILAGAGVAGSLGYLVVLRQRELALRMAIGAEPRTVFRSVLADSLKLGLLGGLLGVGLISLLPLIPAVKTILTTPPGIIPALVAALVVLLAALVAGAIPARRAARIDPIQMLKAE